MIIEIVISAGKNTNLFFILYKHDEYAWKLAA